MHYALGGCMYIYDSNHYSKDRPPSPLFVFNHNQCNHIFSVTFELGPNKIAYYNFVIQFFLVIHFGCGKLNVSYLKNGHIVFSYGF